MQTFEWIVWTITLILSVSQFFTWLFHKQKDGVAPLARGLTLFWFIGLLATIVLHISKLNLIWYVPVTWILNDVIFPVKRGRKYLKERVNDGSLQKDLEEDIKKLEQKSRENIPDKEL